MRDYSLRVYNIGQGLFSLFIGIKDDNEPYVAIFDCGTVGSYDQEITSLCLQEAIWLIRYNIHSTKIDLVVISHQDIDHWNLLLNIIYTLEFDEPECPNFRYAIGKKSFFEKITSENGREITLKNSRYILEVGKIKELVECAETTITTSDKFNDISIIAKYINYNNNSFLKEYSISYELLEHNLNFEVKIIINLYNTIDSNHDEINISNISVEVEKKVTKIKLIEINISIYLNYNINSDKIYLNYSTLEKTLSRKIHENLEGYKDSLGRKIGEFEIEPTKNSIQELINKKFMCDIQKHEPLETTYCEKSSYETPKICISNLFLGGEYEKSSYKKFKNVIRVFAENTYEKGSVLYLKEGNIVSYDKNSWENFIEDTEFEPNFYSSITVEVVKSIIKCFLPEYCIVEGDFVEISMAIYNLYHIKNEDKQNKMINLLKIIFEDENFDFFDVTLLLDEMSEESSIESIDLLSSMLREFSTGLRESDMVLEELYENMRLECNFAMFYLRFIKYLSEHYRISGDYEHEIIHMRDIEDHLCYPEQIHLLFPIIIMFLKVYISSEVSRKEYNSIKKIFICLTNICIQQYNNKLIPNKIKQKLYLYYLNNKKELTKIEPKTEKWSEDYKKDNFKKNLTSLITRFQIEDINDVKKIDILFPGDATYHVFSYLANSILMHNANIGLFIAPHHGSYDTNFLLKDENDAPFEDSEQPLCKLLSKYPPEVVFISSFHPKYGHPFQYFIDKVKGSTIDVEAHNIFCTKLDGTPGSYLIEKAVYSTQSWFDLINPNPQVSISPERLSLRYPPPSEELGPGGAGTSEPTEKNIEIPETDLIFN